MTYLEGLDGERTKQKKPLAVRSPALDGLRILGAVTQLPSCSWIKLSMVLIVGIETYHADIKLYDSIY